MCQTHTPERNVQVSRLAALERPALQTPRTRGVGRQTRSLQSLKRSGPARRRVQRGISCALNLRLGLFSAYDELICDESPPSCDQTVPLCDEALLEAGIK